MWVDAGTPKLEEPLVGVPRQQGRDVEFPLAVESVMAFGDVPSQQAISADDLRLRPAEAIDAIHVDDQKMVAEGVERADVPPHQRRRLIGDRVPFLVEDFIAQALRLSNFLFRRRQPDLERSKTAKDGIKPCEIADEAAWLDEAGGGLCDLAERRAKGPHELSNLTGGMLKKNLKW
ncbi:hypothetical protein MPC1_5640003 [Methylocella tundrae]|nr:hypothetical protein MPC1_5640003 [Methylocella tundrae]